MAKHVHLSGVLLLAALATSAQAGGVADPLRISEIFFDSPGSDVPNEYVEIRGTPNTALTNTYLVFLEAEGQTGTDGLSGNIDSIFDLSGKSIGTNGFATLRMFNAQHTGMCAGTNDYRNTTVTAGFGSNGASSIGFAGTNNNGQIENGGFAAFLVRTSAPINPGDWLDVDLDAENDGKLDSGADYSQAGPQYLYVNPGNPSERWEILDSVGQFEPGEAQTGRGYAAVNYSTGPMNPANLNTGAININTGLTDVVRDGDPNSDGGIEMEYLARWGSRTGNNAEAWFGANVTDNAASGYTSGNRWAEGYRVSGNHALRSVSEAFNGFTDEAAPYGAAIQNTLGRPNYPIRDGDLSQNLAIDQPDLDLVLDHWQVSNPSLLGYWFAGDGIADGNVNQADLDFVLDAWPLASELSFQPANMRFLTGDTDLDGIVDFDDLLTLAQNYGQNVRGYRVGDFDHNGQVDFDDLLGLAQRYGMSWFSSGDAAAFGPAELQLLAAYSIVIPEPSTLSLLLGSTLVRRRRY